MDHTDDDKAKILELNSLTIIRVTNYQNNYPMTSVVFFNLLVFIIDRKFPSVTTVKTSMHAYEAILGLAK